MSVEPISQEAAAQLGIPQNLQGLVITRVQGEAAASGLRPGDVLIAVGGVRTIDLERFSNATERGARSGEILEVLRGGTLHKLFLGRTTSTRDR
jgi:S1-C subfamily serine protease